MIKGIVNIFAKQYEAFLSINFALDELLISFDKECPSENRLREIVSSVNKIQRATIQIERLVRNVGRTVDIFDVIAKTSSILLQTVKLLPVPNQFTTVGVTNTFAEVINIVRERIKAGSETVNQLEPLLRSVLGNINTLKVKVNSVNEKVIACADKQSLNVSEFRTKPFILQSDNSRDFETATFTAPVTYKGYVINVYEDASETLLPRLYALGSDRNGIVRYRSELSFTRSKDILIEQVKLLIDKDLN